MAIQAGVPVVPVSIVGAQKLMRKASGPFIREKCSSASALRSMLRSTRSQSRAELLARVHASVAAGLPPEQQPLPRPSQAAESASR